MVEVKKLKEKLVRCHIVVMLMFVNNIQLFIVSLCRHISIE